MASRVRRVGQKVPAIVLIDDDLELLFALTGSFRVALPGALIFPAASALEALEFIDEQRPDLVIADWLMPGLPGPQLADLLQRPGKPPKTILMTGHPSVGLAYRAITDRRFSAIVSKPFDAHVLTDLAIQLLAESGEQSGMRAPPRRSGGRHVQNARAPRGPIVTKRHR